MANALSQFMPRRSFGFAGQEGEAFDYANQPQNMLANLITNESIQGMQPQNFMRRTGGQRIDLGQSQPMNNLRGSPVDVFGQGRGFMQPDGTIVGVNQQGQRFRVQPEGTAEGQQAARDAALKRRMLMAQVQQEEAKLQGGGGLSPADQLARDKFEWEKSQGKPEKPLTEFQGKAALFGSRAATSSDIIDQLGTGEAGDAKTLQYWQDVPIAGRVANAMSSDKAQQLAQAQRDFVNSVLRLESGATISDQEFQNASQQYFPQPGDSPQVVAQKKQNRELAIQGLGELAGEKGGAYINKQRTAMQPSGQRPNAPKTGEVQNEQGWILHTDAKGNKAYVSPDGKQFKEVR